MKYLTVCILVLALLTLNTQAQTPSLFCTLGKDKDKVRHRSGPEVAKRVKETRKTNPKLNAALAMFERNNHAPKFEDAISISLDYESPGSLASLRSFNHAQLIGGTYEIITVPAYSADGEWQGTVMMYKYDANGNFLDEYIADIIILPDPTYSYWDAILEVSYDYDGAHIQEGTFALYNQLGTPQGGWPATSRALAKSTTQKVNFQCFQWCATRALLRKPRVKAVLKCTAIGCGVVATASCGVTSIFFLGQSFAPCMTNGCTAAVVGCVAYQVFGG